MFAKNRYESQEDIQNFIKDAKIRGEYTVADKTVEFVLNVKDKEIGNATITLKQGYGIGDGLYTSTQMNYNVVQNGMTIPTSTEIVMYDVKHEGNKAVSARMRCFTIASYSILQNGITYEVSSFADNNYYINNENESAPVFDVSVVSETDIKAGNDTQTTRNEMVLSAGVYIPNQFIYQVVQDSIQTAQVEGTITFEKTTIPEIPEQILSDFYSVSQN